MKLSSSARDQLSGKQFAGPNRSFPIEDRDHAEAALLDVGKDKNLTAKQKATVRKRAEAKLHEGQLASYMKKTYGAKA
jgi:hypothetical protein